MKVIIAFATLLSIATAHRPRPMYIDVPISPELTPSVWEKIKANQSLPTKDIDYRTVPDDIQYQPKSSGPAFPPPETRIVNGNIAYPGQFPWQAAIYLETVSFCGGSLIAPKVILTAGHCVHNFTQFTVLMGTHLLLKNESTRVVQITSKGIVHEKFNLSRIEYDIAVLFFENDFPLTDRIATIALPTKSMVSEDFMGYFLTASGWGIWDRQMLLSRVLNYVNVPVMPNKLCAMAFGEIVRPNNICCEGANGRGTCGGDSGGPLTVKTNGKVFVVGIVSFGSRKSCELGLPSVYTRVTSYLDWIQNNTGVVIQE